MSPDRTLSPDEDSSSEDGSDHHRIADEELIEAAARGSSGGAGGGGVTIIGGHVTVETSSPLASPASPARSGEPTASSDDYSTAQSCPTLRHPGSPPNGSSMVLSTIPLESSTVAANHQLILQQHNSSGNILQHHHQQQQQQQLNGAANHSINNNNTSFKNHNSSAAVAPSAATVFGGSNGSSAASGKNVLISSSASGTVGGAGSQHHQLLHHQLHPPHHTYTINLTNTAHYQTVTPATVSVTTTATTVSSSASSNLATNMATGVSGGALALVSGAIGTMVQSSGVGPLPNGSSGGGPTVVMAMNAVPSSSPSALGATTVTTNASSTGMVVMTERNGTSTGSIPPPGSKLVLVHHQGRVGEDYITTAGETINGVGNIVLLATEQMDLAEHDIINNNVIISTTNTTSTTNAAGGGGQRGFAASTVSPHQQHHLPPHHTAGGSPPSGGGGSSAANGDEELTSLTWLQDKNLLKGINLSKVPVSSPDSPRQVVGSVGRVCVSGHISPTSDFVEDSSSVSEDNTSSANSSSEQSNGTYCTETATNTSTTTILTAPDRRTPSQHIFQLGASTGTGTPKTITAINGDTIIEYPVIAVNHHHHVGSNGIQQQVVIDGSKAMKMTVMTATTSTPTSIVMTGGNGVPSTMTAAAGNGGGPLAYVVSSPVTSSGGPIASSTPVCSSSSSNLNSNGNSNGSNSSSCSNSSSSSHNSSTTPHQHFHKKYLREELVKQQQQQQQQQQQHQPKQTTFSGGVTMANSGTSTSFFVTPLKQEMKSAIKYEDGSDGVGTTTSTSIFLTPMKHELKSAIKYEDGADVFLTPMKQESKSEIKYEDGGGDVVEERKYLPPSAPVKHERGGSMSSPNVSGEEYGGGGTVTVYGGLNMIKQSPASSPTHNGHGSTVINGQQQQLQVPHHHHHHQQPSSPPGGSSGSASVSPSKLAPPKAKHPTNVPYDPLVHVNNKPPFSFSSLIFMAIENSQQKALPVKEIYAWIVHQFPYFKTAPTGWKNSVRHNLSLNKCFQKVEKAANLGKGSLWMVEPQYRPNLIQALSRSPFHAGSGIDKATYKSMQQQRSTNASPTGNGSQYSKQDNFPQLASRLAPADAQNGHMHQDDLDDMSRSSTPIDYDGASRDSPSVGSGLPGQHHSNHYQQQPHHHNQHPPTSSSATHHGAVVHQQQPLITFHHNRLGSPDPGQQNGAYLATDGGPTALVQCPSGLVYMNGVGSVAANLPKDMVVGREWTAETIEDVNAATAMLALKHGPKIFTETTFRNGHPPIITTSPSEDHTYSAGGGVAAGAPEQPTTASVNGSPMVSSCYSSSDERYEHSRSHAPNAPNHPTHLPLHQMPVHGNHQHIDNISNGTSSDAAYESSEESHPHHTSSAEDMEERRRQEGVYALLNLSQMAYSSSPSSSMSSSTSTLSSPASSTGSLKRAAPTDSYAPALGGSYRQLAVASPDRARTISPQLPQHTHHLQHLHHHLHQPQPLTNGTIEGANGSGGNTLQTMGITPFYVSSTGNNSSDLNRQYASPPPAKKTKPRSSLKKLKKKSFGR